MLDETQGIGVTIICNAYNHEKYISQAIESFIMQKTSFLYEVLIHDDASIDDTAKIIESYREKYPSIIKPMYEETNQFNSGKDYILDFHYPKVKGKYIIICEGDDFWIDENKLQKQFDYMEKNHNVSLCVHEAIKVKEDGTFLGKYANYGRIKQDVTELTPYFVIRHMDFFPLNSMLFRTDFIKNNELFLRKVKGFDYVYKTLLSTEGTVILLKDSMSAYRVSSVGSWTETVGYNPEKLKNHYQESIEALSLINDYRNHEYNDLISEEILCRKYRILLLEQNYKEAHKNIYRKIRKEFGWKHSIKVFLGAHFPMIIRMINKYDRKR